MCGESGREVPLPLFIKLKNNMPYDQKTLIIHSCTVMRSNILAQLIGFETGIPKQFQTSDKGKITLSTQYYKEGNRVLNGISVPVPSSTLLLNSLSPLMNEWKIHTE